jgi:hypothetical protein
MTGAEQPEQLRRLDLFRARYPAVVIDRVDGFGFWQAWIPERDGGTVITRYHLQDLLSEFDDRHAPPTAEDARPDRPPTQESVRATPGLGRTA